MEASKNGFWCCMPLGWVPCDICQKSPNRSWNSICTDREGYLCKRIHGFAIFRDPYARSMSSNYARDILEQMLRWKELGMLFIALYDIGHWVCDSLCQPCNSAKPHKQRELLVINPVTDLSWLFVSACIFYWNGLQYLILSNLTIVGLRLISFLVCPPKL